jgi:cell division septation protein DedD
MATPSDDDNRPENEHHGDQPNDRPVDHDAENREGDNAKPDDVATLDLQDIDERLPWLESDDDLNQADGSGGRVFGAVLGGLLALAAIVGGIWWVAHRHHEPETVADGGVIKAPEVAYKEAPKSPGGKTFDGTGDSAFAVSEGQTRPARLGQETPPAKPTASPSPKPSASASAAPAAQGGVGVQVGAYSNKATAEAGWTKLQQSHDALSGVSHRVVEGQADIGTVYRLQAVAGDLAAANALCGKLKAGGLSCQVKR